MVSTHSRPKAAGKNRDFPATRYAFQLTAARRRLDKGVVTMKKFKVFQLTAARRRLGNVMDLDLQQAAFQLTAARRRLVCAAIFTTINHAFQLTAARRRLGLSLRCWRLRKTFQLTAARRRLATGNKTALAYAGFNSQPPEGGWDCQYHRCNRRAVSTHSRPKAAGCCIICCAIISCAFQLTAARRRLGF